MHTSKLHELVSSPLLPTVNLLGEKTAKKVRRKNRKSLQWIEYGSYHLPPLVINDCEEELSLTGARQTLHMLHLPLLTAVVTAEHLMLTRKISPCRFILFVRKPCTCCICYLYHFSYWSTFISWRCGQFFAVKCRFSSSWQFPHLQVNGEMLLLPRT